MLETMIMDALAVACTCTTTSTVSTSRHLDAELEQAVVVGGGLHEGLAVVLQHRQHHPHVEVARRRRPHRLPQPQHLRTGAGATVSCCALSAF